MEHRAALMAGRAGNQNGFLSFFGHVLHLPQRGSGRKRPAKICFLLGSCEGTEEGWKNSGEGGKATARLPALDVTTYHSRTTEFSRRLRADACALGVPFAHEDGWGEGLSGRSYALQVTENRMEKDFTTSVNGNAGPASRHQDG